MRNAVVCLIFFFSLSVFGCPHPELTQRYKSVDYTDLQATEGLVKVSIFAIDPPSGGAKATLLSLTPEGQAAFIHALGKKSDSLNELLEALGGEVGKKPGKNAIIDTTVFKKRLVFTVEKELGLKIEQKDNAIRLNPADRISELVVTLKGLNNAKFLSWDRFETKYETVDLGKIGLEKGLQSELGLSIGPKAGASLPITSEPKIAYSRNLTEEVGLRQRYVVVSGRLSKEQADLYQQSVVGIDLTGNFLVDFTIQVDAASDPQPVMIYGPLRKNGKPVAQDEVKIDFVDLKYPKQSDSIQSNLEYEYRLRHVKKNHETVAEGDDEVSFLNGKNEESAKITLIRGEEMKTRVFYLLTRKLIKEYKTSEDGWKLHMEGFDTKPIYFSSYYSAKNFLYWMKETKCTGVANYKFKLIVELKKRDILPDEIATLIVKDITLN